MIALDPGSFATGLAYGAAIGACLAVVAVVLISCVLTEASAAGIHRAPRRLSGNAPTIPVSRVARKATAETMPEIPGLADGRVPGPRLAAALARKTGEHEAIPAEAA